jgi:sulfite exporter TauE/SafE
VDPVLLILGLGLPSLLAVGVAVSSIMRWPRSSWDRFGFGLLIGISAVAVYATGAVRF